MNGKERQWGWAAVLLVTSAFGALYRYLRVSDGKLSYDVRVVWRPAAQKVLDGAALYADVWDNKPPLWEFLNLLVELSGAYVPVFLLLIILANFVTAVLLWQFLSTAGYPRQGLFAAILFISSIAVMHGYQINPRQFANIAILIAVISPRAAISGLSIAAAGLLTQYSVLVIPVILWRRYQMSQTLTDAWYPTFIVSGLGLGLISYALVAGLWGFEAMEAGVRYSFLTLSSHSSHHPSAWDAPIQWGQGLLRNLRWLAALGPLALIGAIKALDVGGSRVHRHSIFLFLLLSPQFLVRTGNVYFVAFLPFLSILAAHGADQILSSTD